MPRRLRPLDPLFEPTRKIGGFPVGNTPFNNFYAVTIAWSTSTGGDIDLSNPQIGRPPESNDGGILAIRATNFSQTVLDILEYTRVASYTNGAAHDAGLYIRYMEGAETTIPIASDTIGLYVGYARVESHEDPEVTGSTSTSTSHTGLSLVATQAAMFVQMLLNTPIDTLTFTGSDWTEVLIDHNTFTKGIVEYLTAIAGGDPALTWTTGTPTQPTRGGIVLHEGLLVDPVTFVAAGAHTSQSSLTPTIPIPAHQAGDLLILIVNADNLTNVTVPSGWSSKHTSTVGGTADAFICTKPGNGSESSVVLASATAAEPTVGIVLAYRDAAYTAFASSGAASSVGWNFTGMTPTPAAVGSRVIWIVWHDNGSGIMPDLENTAGIQLISDGSSGRGIFVGDKRYPDVASPGPFFSAGGVREGIWVTLQPA